MHNIVYRNLKENELDRIKEIDRAEHILESYEFKNDQLVLMSTPSLVTSFDQKELEYLIKCQSSILADGGEVIGAWDEHNLVGVASVENKPRGHLGEYCKMDILYVSNRYRGKKIGHQLVYECKQIAKKFGAKKLYISATPTKATVDFYIKEGAVIIKNTDPELFELEPLDIHLELPLT